MPGNIYGVANPLSGAAQFTWVSDTVCNAGVDTVVSNPTGAASLSPGNYFIFWWMKFVLTMGATPPTAITVSAQINGGSNIGSHIVPVSQLVANANVLHVGFFRSAASNTLYFPQGQATFTVSVNPVAQSVTFRNSGALGFGLAFRVAD